MNITLNIDYDQLCSEGLESAIASSLVKKLGQEFREKAEDLITEKTGALMVAAVNHAVEVKLSALMDEPVVMTDRYGSKKFLGSVEDYIKQEIDNRLLRPVDSNGKTLTGSCSNSDAKVWLEWSVDQTLTKMIDQLMKKFEQTAREKLERIVCQKTDEIVSEKTKNAVAKAMAGLLSGGKP